jgi:hypothetical protein
MQPLITAILAFFFFVFLLSTDSPPDNTSRTPLSTRCRNFTATSCLNSPSRLRPSTSLKDVSTSDAQPHPHVTPPPQGRPFSSSSFRGNPRNPQQRKITATTLTNTSKDVNTRNTPESRLPTRSKAYKDQRPNTKNLARPANRVLKCTFTRSYKLQPSISSTMKTRLANFTRLLRRVNYTSTRSFQASRSFHSLSLLP